MNFFSAVAVFVACKNINWQVTFTETNEHKDYRIILKLDPAAAHTETWTSIIHNVNEK